AFGFGGAQGGAGLLVEQRILGGEGGGHNGTPKRTRSILNPFISCWHPLQSGWVGLLYNVESTAMSKTTADPNLLTLALAQIAPCWLDRARTLQKVEAWVERAAAEGCHLVAFGEAFVPGYPFWVELTDGARFNSPLQKAIFAEYAEQAVQARSGTSGPLARHRQGAGDRGLPGMHRARGGSRRTQPVLLARVHRSARRRRLGAPQADPHVRGAAGLVAGRRARPAHACAARLPCGRVELLGELDAAVARGALRAGRRSAHRGVAGEHPQHARHYAIYRPGSALVCGVGLGPDATRGCGRRVRMAGASERGRAADSGRRRIVPGGSGWRVDHCPGAGWGDAAHGDDRFPAGSGRAPELRRGRPLCAARRDTAP